MNLGQLKSIEEDFLVSEAVMLPFSGTERKKSRYYYVLTKRNYTTFEAVEAVTNHFKLHVNSVEYLGLKDEDGITKQHIALPFKLDNSQLHTFNRNFKETNRFINCYYLSSGNLPFVIGHLLGNHFRVIVRKLEQDTIEKLKTNSKKNAFFINYYGSQRFGLPNAEKNTHLMGLSLIEKDYKRFITLLAKQPNALGLKAKSFTGVPEDFLKLLPVNLQIFYRSSYYSYLWNKKLKAILASNDRFNSQCIIYNDSGIEYVFAHDARKIVSELETLNIEYTRAKLYNGEFQTTTSVRTALIQTHFVCNNVKEDVFNPNYFCCELDFFLPSGSYATMAVPQFILNVIKKKTDRQSPINSRHKDSPPFKGIEIVNKNVINFRPVLSQYYQESSSPIRFYRSGNLSGISLAAARFLNEECNIGLHIDLRSQEEIDKLGLGISTSLIDAKIETRVFPLQDYEEVFKQVDFPTSDDYYHYYRQMIESNSATIASVMKYIAYANCEAFILSCHLGKDRTGVITLLILGIIGVDKTLIMNDYQISEFELLDRLDSLKSHWEKRGFTKDQYKQRFLMGTPALQKLYDYIEKKYGSFREFAGFLGLSDVDINQLQIQLSDLCSRSAKKFSGKNMT